MPEATAKKTLATVPAPPPDKEDEYIPSLEEMVPRAADRLKLGRMIEEHRKVSIEAAKYNKIKKGLVNPIKTMLGKFSIGKCTWKDLRVNYFNSPRTYLDKATLLELGVPVETIVAATKTAPCYYLRITPMGGKEEEEEE